MYTSFSIENFRCFEHITIKPLARFNLIAGKNNAGKTAFLEALYVHTKPNDPRLSVQLAELRGISISEQPPPLLLHDLFYNFEPNNAITITAEGDWHGNPRVLNIRLQPREVAEYFQGSPRYEQSSLPDFFEEIEFSDAPVTEIVFEYWDETGWKHVSRGWKEQPEQPERTVQRLVVHRADVQTRINSVFLSASRPARPRTSREDVNRFGQVELEGYSHKIVEYLKTIDSRVQRLTTIAAGRIPMIYAEVGLGRPVPIGFMGDGIGRLLSMSLAFYAARDGVIFIAEIENGLHHTVLQDVWQKLYWLSREFNVQVFATTHSYECLVAARNAFRANEDKDMLIHRLGRWEDEPIKATTYSYEALDFSLDFPAEVR